MAAVVEVEKVLDEEGAAAVDGVVVVLGGVIRLTGVLDTVTRLGVVFTCDDLEGVGVTGG